MSKSLLFQFSLLAALCATNGHLSFAQPGWVWQNPLPQGNTLHSVSFTDANTGTAVGDCGSIIRTTDGGVNWTIQLSGTTNSLRSVCLIDANTGMAVGDTGTILRTINGGASWTIQSSGTTNGLLGVHFTDANTGTVVGDSGTVLRTTNGGTNWTSQLNGSAPYLKSVSFTDVNNGCAVGDDGQGSGIILRTTDSGVNWTSWTNQAPNGNPTFFNIYSICFTDTNTGTAVGSTAYHNSYLGIILRTNDGGASWTSQTSGTTNYLYSVCFTDTSTGTAVGSRGTILRTTDGGASWMSQSSGTTVPLYSVSFTDANTGTAVGYYGIILRTTNGGANWTCQSAGTTMPFNSVFFTDANTGWAVGSGVTNLPNTVPILHTTNGGVNWTNQQNPAIYPLYSVYFTDANTGTAVGQSGEILRTTDGGASWTHQYITIQDLYSVYFTDANTGIAVGNNGIIIRTTNGGANWTSQSIGQVFYRGVCFSDANTGWAVGDNNIIIHTTNGGASWTNQSIGETETFLYKVCFTDANTGWVIGEKLFSSIGYMIFRTTDGGESWTRQYNSGINDLYSISFTSANTGTVVGYRPRISMLVGGRTVTLDPTGIILQTTNGGASWIEQSNVTTNFLSGVCFTDANNGTIVGSGGGTILRMKNSGGISSQPNVVLSSISLSFNKVKLGQYKETSIIIKNEGGDILRINNITSNNPVFSIVHTSLVIPPGQKSRDTLRFTPAAIGDAAAILLVFSNAPSSPDTLYVYGNGFITGVTQLSNNNFDFGRVMLGQSKDTTVTITNIGNDTLRINSIVSSGLTFAARPTVISIAPGQSSTDTLRFTPSIVSADSALIIIQSDANRSPDTIKVLGIGDPTTKVDVGVELPKYYALNQNYPNPFNPITTIEYQIPLSPFSEKGERGGFVSLKVYDLLGREVATLVNEQQPAGIYTKHWNASEMPSGVYFYRLQAGTFTETKKLILLR